MEEASGAALDDFVSAPAVIISSWLQKFFPTSERDLSTGQLNALQAQVLFSLCDFCCSVRLSTGGLAGLAGLQSRRRLVLTDASISRGPMRGPLDCCTKLCAVSALLSQEAAAELWNRFKPCGAGHVSMCSSPGVGTGCHTWC